MNSFAILIPNYNGARFIAETVGKFASGFPGAQIVVVDDVSTDDSLSRLSETMAGVLVREKNGGFAAAVNTGLRFLANEGFDNVLIANSDVVVDDLKCAEIAAALATLSAGSNVAVLGFLEESIMSSTPHQGSNISGFLFALRLDTIKAIGYLDESFFMYGEEQDYFRRVLEAGLVIRQTEIRVKHLAEGSGSSKLRNSWLAIRNSLYLETKRAALWGICRKAGVLFLLINRLYRPRAGEDPSLQRVLRPGIILGNLFLFWAICWNAVKLLKMLVHGK
jgi:GT2 family glycosyltransferase